MSNFEQIRGYATPVDVQCRWSDQDVNGHINNVSILTLIEEARIRVTQQWLAITPGSSGPSRIIRALNTTFDREVNYGQATTVWVWVPRIGSSSFTFGQLLTQGGQPCVYAEATMVIVDAATGKPQQLDTAYRNALEAHAGPAFSARTE